MPAFVPDGPEVPERLLQAHEEGRVVFFCGAGIAYPAGLPGFQDLVKRVYAEIGETCDEVERTAYRQHRYDETFDLLERRLKDRDKDQLFVRKAVAKILEPKLRSKGAQDTHKALLDLSRDKSGATRLVTTNFDRIFELVNRQQKRHIASFLAPLLPIPKITKWDGIVYLHGGLLSKSPTATDLNRIVLSSGDFGLAYLNERWAARFVSELLKNFIVCFVGYSIEDPVLRYMMDAVAADELLGEDRIESFAFASFKAGEQDSMDRKWRAKGVEPLLFDQDAGGARFAVLHETIQEWARVYTTGTHGKRMIVSTHAAFPPKVPSRSDYVAGRMLWALTDPKAAQHFAELNPVPPLDWLEPLAEFLFDASDLCRFGVKEKVEEDDDRTFAMLRRPSPSTLSPWMEIASHGARWTKLDPVMWHLARWLTRHLDNSKLVLWIASQGGWLHPDFRQLVAARLSGLRKLEIDGEITKLSEIKANEPDGIPGPAMRKLWQLILSGRLKGSRDLNFYDWFSRLAVDGWTSGLKSELRDLLRPRVALAQPYGSLVLFDEEVVSDSVSAFASWEVVLTADYACTVVRQNQTLPAWRAGLPGLLGEFKCLLNEALELIADLSAPEEGRKMSVLDIPSIKDHSQNRGDNDWTVLVSLTRDAWLEVAKIDPERARHIADEWWSSDTPIFKRMALFAAAQDGVLNDAQGIGWLLDENGKWLWDVETRRETLRLLVTLSGRWQATPPRQRRNPVQSQLERSILAGPPRAEVAREVDEDEFIRYRERQIWLRLGKLSSGGYRLGPTASKRLSKIQEAHPRWRFTDDEREEFAFFIGMGTGEIAQISTPTKPRELIEWLDKHPKQDVWQDDQWRDRCRTHFRSVAVALRCSYQMGKRMPERLSAALNAWAGDESLLSRSWRCMGTFLAGLADEQKVEILGALAWWVQAGSRVVSGDDSSFYSLANDLVRLSVTDDSAPDRDIMFVAINHPVGHATQAVLNHWFRNTSKHGREFEGDAREFFTRICSPGSAILRNGRVVLAQATAWLYQADAEWTKEFLLPLFSWATSPFEAKACWTGFLYSPRRIPALLKQLKENFLETASHLEELGNQCREAYARFFTFVALEPAGIFSDGELRAVLAGFDVRDLDHAARALSDVMEGAGEKQEVLWRESVRPFIENCWPKAADRRSGQIAGRFALVCIAASDEFPHAVAALRPFFQPMNWPSILLDKLKETNLHKRFPREALDLIFRVVGESPSYPPRELEEILLELVAIEPKLKQLIAFKKLRSLLE